MARHTKRPQKGGPPIALAGLEDLGRDELAARWRDLYRAEPPPRIRRPLLHLAVGWAIQAREQGGLTPARERQLLGSGKGPRCPRRRLKPGTRLVLEWHGAVHVVEARERGFVWQDRHYASLSAIARAITGANWSGPRFFGLTAGTGP